MTFALAAKIVTVCTLISSASTRNWLVHQMNVHNAFLYWLFNGGSLYATPTWFSPFFPRTSLLSEEVLVWSSPDSLLLVLQAYCRSL